MTICSIALYFISSWTTDVRTDNTFLNCSTKDCMKWLLKIKSYPMLSRILLHCCIKVVWDKENSNGVHISVNWIAKIVQKFKCIGDVKAKSRLGRLLLLTKRDERHIRP